MSEPLTISFTISSLRGERVTPELQAMEVMYQIMAGVGPLRLTHDQKVRACRWITALVEAEPTHSSDGDRSIDAPREE